MAIVKDLTALIGHTPLLEASRLSSAEGLSACLLLKLERFNPAGSVKDRVALAMIEDAEERGLLTPGGCIVEPTSGNTGIGLAAIAAVRGYRVVLTMPETMSVERRKLLAAYGAEIVLTEGSRGMKGAMEKAEELMRGLPGAWMPGQFENPANPAAHWRGTGREIWEDCQGQVDGFVSGVGTGGTLSGVGRYLKERNPAVRVIGVEPLASPVLSQGRSGAHGLQGIGAGFVPKALDTGIYDEVIPVDEAAAYESARKLARLEGILVGISSGAALWAAMELARKPEYAGKTLVALMPDTGERYLSTPLFDGAE